MVRLIAQRDRQTVETGGVGRQAKSQEVIGPLKASAPDMLSRQCGMPLQRLGMPGKPKQWRASCNRKPRLQQNLVQFAGLLLKLAARAVGPWTVAERRGTDQQRRPGTWPWTQGRGDTFDRVRSADGKS